MDVKTKAILRAASFMLGIEVERIEDLTDNQLIFLQRLTIYELNRCFIETDLLAGKLSLVSIAMKYGVSKKHVVDCSRRLAA